MSLFCCFFQKEEDTYKKKDWQSLDNDNTESIKKIYGKDKKKKEEEENKVETYSSNFGDSNSYGGANITSTTSYGYGSNNN